MAQTLAALAAAHELNVTHRCARRSARLGAPPSRPSARVHSDLKPGNVLVKSVAASHEPEHWRRPRSAAEEHTAGTGYISLCDFGSAVDTEALSGLYGPFGPSLAEVTLDYAPPEVRRPPSAATCTAARPRPARPPHTCVPARAGPVRRRALCADAARELRHLVGGRAAPRAHPRQLVG